MAVLFVVGLMNVAWTAAIAVVFLAERTWGRGVRVAGVVGLALTGLGIAVLVHPSILTTAASVHPRVMTG
jgi:predicted metal-binding membrane protein